MPRRVLSLLAGLAGAFVATSATAMGPGCVRAMANVDTFGEVRWLDGVRTIPAGSSEVRCEPDNPRACRFHDRLGVAYETLDGTIVDKELGVGPASPLPWGLRRDDPPAVVRGKLSMLSAGLAHDGVREGYRTVELRLPQCDDVWVEVRFDPGRGVRSISLNAQPQVTTPAEVR
jgi:hypothetical protein